MKQEAHAKAGFIGYTLSFSGIATARIMTMAIPDVEILPIRLYTTCFSFFRQMAPISMVQEQQSFRTHGVMHPFMELKLVQSSSIGALPIHLFRHFCCRMYRLATMHSVRTDGRTDDIMMPIAYPKFLMQAGIYRSAKNYPVAIWHAHSR